jgi:hypothetical protein
MAYKVMIADGPAAGWTYTTSVPPDPVIAVAPAPREDERSRRTFMRVLLEGEPWPGQHQYARGELPGVDVLLDELEDVLVRYRVVQ